VIRNLMERIDSLEGELARAQGSLRELRSARAWGTGEGGAILGVAQSLRDREILEYLGDGAGVNGEQGEGNGARESASSLGFSSWLGEGDGI
jgi:hypothetical protein